MQLAKWVLRFDGGRIEPRRREYWSWLAMALFLLTTVDLVTTTFATYRFGVGGEANPLVREALVLGPVFFVTINLVAVIVVTLLFDKVIWLLERAPDSYARYLSVGIEVWLGGLIAAGLLVFANNLTVIFFGQSLI